MFVEVAASRLFDQSGGAAIRDDCYNTSFASKLARHSRNPEAARNMPWKEPGDKPRAPRDRQSRGREPWGQGGPDNNGGPDLDAWLKKFRRGLGPFGRGPWNVIAVIVVVIVLWFLIGGWTMIGDHQVGVVLRFGRLQAVLQPGFHLRLPSPIDRVQKLDLGKVRTLSDQTRLMTSDGDVVLVDYYVRYKVTNAARFLFADRDAEDAARNAAAIAVRAVIGTHTLPELTRREGDGLGPAIQQRLQASLGKNDIGIHVTEAGIQDIGVPSQVQPAFDGIDQAREDAKSAQTAAQSAVASGKVKVKAQAESIGTQAAAYRSKAVADAQADVAGFDQVLPQYQAAPQVTRHRLWLETMQDVLSKNRVVVNSGSGSVIVQFPTHHAAEASPAPASSSAPASASSAAAAPAASITSGPTLQGQGT